MPFPQGIFRGTRQTLVRVGHEKTIRTVRKFIKNISKEFENILESKKPMEELIQLQKGEWVKFLNYGEKLNTLERTLQQDYLIKIV